MRKLKLQMQMSIDGYVAGPNGEQDWVFATGAPSPADFQHIVDLASSSDTMLLGRKMTREFIDYWEGAASNSESPLHSFANQIVDMRKIAFSKTETEIKGKNLTVENGDLVTAVNALKNETGKDIIVYGGADFVHSLISNNLIDEYYIISNPISLGNGLRIFSDRKLLKLESSTPFKSGKILNKFLPA